MITILLAFSLACGFTQGGPKLDATTQTQVKSFCEMMTEPKQFHDKPITLRATALVRNSGMLLRSDKCQAPDISVHYVKDYEQHSNVDAVATLERFRRQVREVYLRDGGAGFEMVTVGVVLEGRLEKNQMYHVEMARGDKTVAAWDYQYEYAFVVTRVVSLTQPE